MNETRLTTEKVEACRRQFPALQRMVNGQAAVFLDGPAGTQVPQRVIDAVSNYYVRHNANHGGEFVTSRESDAMLEAARGAVADLLGSGDPDTIVFGPNMTTLTFGVSRALAKTWERGDEVLVTRLDHDANVTPWVLAARDAGARVQFVEIHRDDCTLDLEDLRSKLSERTRLVAVGCASNATGTINPVRDICRWAHDVGAAVFLDAVHYAPHALMDVEDFGCDLLACSAYKFFGPHVGILWGRRGLLEQLPAYKLRPVPDTLPDKWMTGTQNHEGIAGVLAAVEYLADLGRDLVSDATLNRRAALNRVFTAIGQYERQLVGRLLAALEQRGEFQVWGIRDPGRLVERLPTVSVTHRHIGPRELARHLAAVGIFVWHGNYYALELSEALGHEPAGMLRIGLVHYNTAEEVDRLIHALDRLPTSGSKAEISNVE